MAIESFQGKWRFLSNFWPSPITFSGATWPTAEHVYQAAKTLDTFERAAIRLLATPGMAKKKGRYVVLRPNWEEVKVGIMATIIRLKFKQNPMLLEKLIATGKEMLIEGNRWHDNFWGDCDCPKCRSKAGQNLLGRLLMAERDRH